MKTMQAAIAMFVVAFTFSSQALFAQAKTTFGIRAGINFQNITGRAENDDRLDNKLKTGFNAGVNAEIPIGIDFYLQPGVLFSTKGTKFRDADANVGISYLEIPVNFLYKPELGSDHVLLGFGPYLAFGIGGKFKANGNSTDVKFENSVPLGSTGVYYKRIDAGANLLAGYEFANRLSFQINAQMGLVKINPKFEDVDNDQSSLKNTGFGLSIGYRF